ncbi:MAG: nicotinate (nicotinamide) nucleotide adenylyltransferase [Planctomycetes bacterium]|jgi:nicotinate-nucleotide adenylyltransferase|nr:nicotinate (nicotinamide) nucleotide adenylyltransferase [Planctomycetota bacterium]
MELADIQRLIVFGGSFDPPHRAHVTLPAAVRDRLGSDAVAYIPAGRAPHKLDQPQTDAAHRLAMTRLAVADDPRALVLDVEVSRDPELPSYTVDTLAWLATQLPDGASMRLLIGSDQMLIFDQWKDAKRIVALAEPVVMVRPPETADSVLTQLPAVQRGVWSRRLIEVPAMDVSSTMVRDRLAAGQAIDDLVPPAVAAYIRSQGLYR